MKTPNFKKTFGRLQKKIRKYFETFLIWTKKQGLPYISKSKSAADKWLGTASIFTKKTLGRLRKIKLKPIGIAKNIFLIFMDVTVMLATLAIITVFYVYKNTPLPDVPSLKEIAQTTAIYDRSGTHVLYEIHGEENRKVIAHDEIPETVRLATIASEDNDFFSHGGVDLKSIVRALISDVKSNELEQGGSTITQQLVRNLYLSREKTFRRKFLEAILSIKLEKKYSKDQILDMYLNEVPYGSNAYGIEAAAETFFKKNAPELSLDEAVFLAALPNAPTYFSPYGNHASELAGRQKKILDRMFELGFINQTDYTETGKIVTLTKVVPFKEPIDCPHFVFYVKEQLEKMYGRDMVENGGLKVYTTLDYDMQKLAEKVVSEGAKKNQAIYNAENASLVSLDPKSGQILAMVGSRDFFDAKIDGQVNVAVRERQPGSSFKPFAYAEAFLKGYRPESILIDAPTNFGPDGSGRNYIPNNYDGKFHGVVTMRQALAMSLNIPAVKTLYLAGVDDTVELANRMGITTLDRNDHYGLALVLGGGGVTLLDETAGYAVFANDGKRNPATPFLKIIDSEGKTILNPSPENARALNEQAARMINSILSDNAARTPMFGPNNKLHIPGYTVAAKTGTSQEYRDAWTVGYTPGLATGVWAGNNNYNPMKSGSAGTYVAAPIWYDFMTQALKLKNYPDETFLAYDRKEGKSPSETKDFKVSYYNKKTGKKLSDKKRAKTDPKDIEMRIELPENYAGGLPEAYFENKNNSATQHWHTSL